MNVVASAAPTGTSAAASNARDRLRSISPIGGDAAVAVAAAGTAVTRGKNVAVNRRNSMMNMQPIKLLNQPL